MTKIRRTGHKRPLEETPLVHSSPFVSHIKSKKAVRIKLLKTPHTLYHGRPRYQDLESNQGNFQLRACCWGDLVSKVSFYWLCINDLPYPSSIEDLKCHSTSLLLTKTFLFSSLQRIFELAPGAQDMYAFGGYCEQNSDEMYES
jgi:hypothetical protein